MFSFPANASRFALPSFGWQIKNSPLFRTVPRVNPVTGSSPLTPKAIDLLAPLYVERFNEWVFNNSDDERLSYEALRYQTRCACRDAGIQHRGEHVFRHTFATNCYHKGVNIKILSRLLGHADVNVTYNIYIHLYGDGFDEMYSALVPERQ